MVKFEGKSYDGDVLGKHLWYQVQEKPNQLIKNLSQLIRLLDYTVEDYLMKIVYKCLSRLRVFNDELKIKSLDYLKNKETIDFEVRLSIISYVSLNSLGSKDVGILKALYTICFDESEDLEIMQSAFCAMFEVFGIQKGDLSNRLKIQWYEDSDKFVEINSAGFQQELLVIKSLINY